MSYTEIYGFDKKGNAFFYDEVHNSWLGAIAIWKKLSEKYLPEYNFVFNMKPVWDLFTKDYVSIVDKICLGTTFDKVLVKKENIPKVIKAFLEFDGETSLKNQADILQKMYENDNCIAVGWNQTSVNSAFWFVGYDDEKDEKIPYNIFSMKEHWWLFDNLEGNNE